MPHSITISNEGLDNDGTLEVGKKRVHIDSKDYQPLLVWNKRIPDTIMEKFRRHIEMKYNLHFSSYWDFHKWSVESYVDFWEEIWNYFDILKSKSYDKVLVKTGSGFLDNEWFSGALFNYAENILRFRDNSVALICVDERGFEESITFDEMFEEVKIYAAAFRKLGLQKNDRVACYMSNRKEPVFAMLAATSIGAIWGGSLPYFGARAASQIMNLLEPKFLIAVDHHQDNGKDFYPIDNLPLISESTRSLEKVIIVPTKEETMSRDISNIRNGCFLHEFLQYGRSPDGTVPELVFEQLPFSHPISINFTSGTTSTPKGPVHAAGALLAELKEFAFHLNLKRGDTAFACFSVGWTLWNKFICPLALGVKVLLYAGSCSYERKDSNIWDILSKHNVNFAFLVPSEVHKMEKMQMVPSPEANLDSLKILGMGGSPVKMQNFQYLHKIKKDLFVGSMYGCTECYGGFSGFDLNSPSYAGEIQAPGLGVDIKCFDSEGRSVVGEIGELVIATPSVSFPIYLWKDVNRARLNETYLSKYEGVWNQSDECWINPKTHGFVVIGRSDDTLKQYGERFSAGDIYFAIHQMEELQDYVCVSQDRGMGDARAVLFVKLKEGYSFTPQLRDKIASTINRELWTEYVPQVIMETQDIPYNLNNKKMESVVRRILATNKVPEVMNIRNPECLKSFCDIPEIINYNKN